MADIVTCPLCESGKAQRIAQGGRPDHLGYWCENCDRFVISDTDVENLQEIIGGDEVKRDLALNILKSMKQSGNSPKKLDQAFVEEVRRRSRSL